ncbi:hypothetical protein VTO73DRAFT_13178 [Trametes versicolor]
MRTLTRCTPSQYVSRFNLVCIVHPTHLIQRTALPDVTGHCPAVADGACSVPARRMSDRFQVGGRPRGLLRSAGIQGANMDAFSELEVDLGRCCQSIGIGSGSLTTVLPGQPLIHPKDPHFTGFTRRLGGANSELLKHRCAYTSRSCESARKYQVRPFYSSLGPPGEDLNLRASPTQLHPTAQSPPPIQVTPCGLIHSRDRAA